MNGNELTVRSENKMVSKDTWNTLYSQAAEIIKSGFLPPSIKTPAQAIAVILTGRELGIGMMEAFRGIHIIDNRPSISPQLMMSLIYNSGVAENIKIESTATCCTVSGNRKGHSTITAKFTTEDAKNMGLLFRDNWKKQQQNMLRWRAISAWARITCPDVIGGLYTPEELENSTDIVGKDVSALEMSEKVNTNPDEYDKFREEVMAGIMDSINLTTTTQDLSSIRKQYEKEIGLLNDEDRAYIQERFDSQFQALVGGLPGEVVVEEEKVDETGQETPKKAYPGAKLSLEEMEVWAKEWIPQAIKEIDACDTTAKLTVWKNQNTENMMKLLKEYREYVQVYLKSAIQNRGKV
jgi:hypothetical protein